MKTNHPIDIIMGYIEESKDDKNNISVEIIKDLYNQEEFSFTIHTSGMKYENKTKNYTKKLEELDQNEIQLLIGNWLHEFDKRSKEAK